MPIGVIRRRPLYRFGQIQIGSAHPDESPDKTTTGYAALVRTIGLTSLARTLCLF